jgi:hypothetical protein
VIKPMADTKAAVGGPGGDLSGGETTELPNSAGTSPNQAQSCRGDTFIFAH